MMSMHTFVIAAAVAGIVPAVALADPPFGPGGRGLGWGMGHRPGMGMAADLNGDGTVTAEEHAAFQAQRWSQRPMLRADANGDGVATSEERAAFQRQWQAGRPCPWMGGQPGAAAGTNR